MHLALGLDDGLDIIRAPSHGCRCKFQVWDCSRVGVGRRDGERVSHVPGNTRHMHTNDGHLIASAILQGFQLVNVCSSRPH